MSRFSRPLYIVYGALLAWLAYCAIQSARNDATWACVMFVLASGLAIVAFVREGELEDALRREAVRAERDARAGVRPTTDAIDAAAAVALAAACCEPWWASCGAKHDATCPNQHRSAA
ncbi:hypothetical protein OHA71_23655 [Streptomyces sp. NBC_00444]|uniref:hypothetical protein n=1 Tax=Streptomyces sp. NBC_00444 TaxID=2975744 RepID=UPI002E202A90